MYNKLLNLKIKSFFILITFILFYHSLSLRFLYPVSFGIVRHSDIHVNLTTYMNDIGYPQLDQNGNNIGYNIIALDGFKTQTKSLNLLSDLTPIGTWANLYSRIMGNIKNLYGKNTSDIQKFIVKKFHSRGSKILMNAFSNQRPISEKNSDPLILAEQITSLIINHNLDGINIQFQDFNAVRQKNASNWLLTLIKNLRKKLGKQKLIILQIPPTFVNQLQIFKKSLINSYCDLYVFKYFNLLNEDFDNFDSIFIGSKNYTMTSIWQIQLDSNVKIDTCKIIIAKPSTFSNTWTPKAYLPSNNLASLFQEARIKYSWFGGYANLDFGSDTNGQFQQTVLNSLRQYCYKFEKCYCK